jgi:hypothetical protein
MQLASQAPQLYDMAYLHRQMLEVLNIKNAEKLVKLEDDQKPVDPISENMNAVNGKPMKAFIYQDHDAHIAAHQAFMSDPVVMQTIGQNPQANQIMAALQAHIAEHLGFQYRSQIEKQMGVPLPPPDKQLPEQVEVDLSRLVATASQQLLQLHKQQTAQQQAQQQAQDPLVQMQQQELQQKAQEIQRKAQKDQADIQLEAEKLQLEREKMQLQAQMEQMKLENAAQKAVLDHKHKEDLEKTRMAVQVAVQQAKGI